MPNSPGLPPVRHRLETLADCSAYILALPEREHARWEGLVAELLKAATPSRRGWSSQGNCTASQALVPNQSGAILARSGRRSGER
jgi:hypothetical protein